VVPSAGAVGVSVDDAPADPVSSAGVRGAGAWVVSGVGAAAVGAGVSAGWAEGVRAAGPGRGAVGRADVSVCAAAVSAVDCAEPLVPLPLVSVVGAAAGAAGAAFLAARRPPFLIGSFASLSLRRRSTGASTVDEADRTNSPMSFSVVRTSLLVTPSSFASS
jgi:hypothetical protein